MENQTEELTFGIHVRRATLRDIVLTVMDGGQTNETHQLDHDLLGGLILPKNQPVITAILDRAAALIRAQQQRLYAQRREIIQLGSQHAALRAELAASEAKCDHLAKQIADNAERALELSLAVCEFTDASTSVHTENTVVHAINEVRTMDRGRERERTQKFMAANTGPDAEQKFMAVDTDPAVETTPVTKSKKNRP